MLTRVCLLWPLPLTLHNFISLRRVPDLFQNLIKCLKKRWKQNTRRKAGQTGTAGNRKPKLISGMSSLGAGATKKGFDWDGVRRRGAELLNLIRCSTTQLGILHRIGPGQQLPHDSHCLKLNGFIREVANAVRVMMAAAQVFLKPVKTDAA